MRNSTGIGTHIKINPPVPHRTPLRALAVAFCTDSTVELLQEVR